MGEGARVRSLSRWLSRAGLGQVEEGVFLGSSENTHRIDPQTRCPQAWPHHLTESKSSPSACPLGKTPWNVPEKNMWPVFEIGLRSSL